MHDERRPITVVYEELESREGEKRGVSSAARRLPKVGPLDDAALASNLQALTGDLSSVLDELDAHQRGFVLAQFEVTVELTAKGELRLIGSVGAEVRGGLKLTFARTPA